MSLGKIILIEKIKYNLFHVCVFNNLLLTLLEFFFLSLGAMTQLVRFYFVGIN